MNGFDGTWQIDPRDPRSRVWNPVAQFYVPDTIGDEVITLQHAGDRQLYRVRYGQSPTVVMEHVCVYDDDGWAPYQVVEKIDEPATDPDNSNWAREFVVGQPFSYVRTVVINERVHCRLMRTPAGNARAILTRTLASDGASYVSTVLDPVAGRIKMVRVFHRITT